MTALSFLWLFWVAFTPKKSYSIFNIAVTLAAAAEALFFAYYLNTRKRLQKPCSLPHRCESAKERRDLINKCLRTLTPVEGQGAPQEKLRVSLENWFFGAPLETISRNDFASWASWAFFNSDLDALGLSDRAELEESISYFEGQVGWVFNATSKVLSDYAGLP